MSLILNAAACAALILMSSAWAGARWGALVLLALLTLQGARFRFLSHTDALTGLFNLRHLQKAERYYLCCREVAVWYLDVDHLKQVNDTRGHGAGDLLLREVAGHLRSISAPGARAYRLGGDEFLLIVPNPAGTASPLPSGIHGVSSGCARGRGKELRQLMLQAEQQMYRSRRSAGNESPNPCLP